ELVFVNGNLPHGWFTNHCTSLDIREITLQFHKNLFDENFLNRNQLNNIKNLLEISNQGILFSRETAEIFKPRIESLTTKRGFDSILELLSILDGLGIARNSHILSISSSTNDNQNFNSRRLEKAFDYLR